MTQLSPSAALRAARQAFGYSTVELAELVDVHPNTIRHLEAGRTQDVKLRLARRIAAALRQSLDDVFPREEK